MYTCFVLGQFLTTFVTKVSLRKGFVPTFRTFFGFFFDLGATIHAKVGTGWKILATL
jgi:hypothetical protein